MRIWSLAAQPDRQGSACRVYGLRPHQKRAPACADLRDTGTEFLYPVAEENAEETQQQDRPSRSGRLGSGPIKVLAERGIG